MYETSDDAMKREPEVRQEVVRLQNVVQELGKSLDGLHGRLVEVLRKTEETTAPCPADSEAPYSDLGGRIRNEVDSLFRLNGVIISLIDRLEV